MTLKKLFLYFSLLLIVVTCRLADENYLNYRIPLIKLMDSLHITAEDIVVFIDKSNYKLSILSDSVIIKEYPVVFGGNPTDDKLMQGDQCTPEGTFYINSKYPHKSWEKFIWLNYPTSDSWNKHNEAKQNGKIPMNADIGGEIGIHGVPNNMNILIDLKQNWTLGCISLKNKDINEIYPFINEKTKIEIR
jgi:murein L,D-transpeptidase YafK